MDDHVRLLCSGVLRHLSTSEERKLLASGDFRQLWKARLLREGGRILGSQEAGEKDGIYILRFGASLKGKMKSPSAKPSICLTWDLHCCLCRFNVLLGGSLKSAQLIIQLLQLLVDRLPLGLSADIAHLPFTSHEEVHPLLAGETSRDLVSHRSRISASPSENGIALLWMMDQEIREVVDILVDGNPTIMRLVVTSHL